MSLSDQKRVNDFLIKVLAFDKVNSAYLFSGLRYLGKSKSARRFIEAIVCDQAETAACGRCSSCHLMQKRLYPDFYEVNPEKGKQEIIIEQIKNLRKNLEKSSFKKNGYKAVIIHEADMMNLSAANALLKILEEPYGKTIFILLDNKQKHIMPTVISRCQVIRFYPLAAQNIIERLLKQSISLDRAQKIVSLAGSLPILADQYAASEKLWREKKDRLNKMLSGILSNSLLPELIAGEKNSWPEEQIRIKGLLEDYKLIWHNIFLLKLNLDTYLQKEDNLEQLRQFTSKLPLKVICAKIESIVDAQKHLKYNVPGQILLSNLIFA